MSCCPSVKCRNTGSGYVKPSSGASAETSKKLDELMATRSQQDYTFFPPLHTQAPVQQQQQGNVCSTDICTIPINTIMVTKKSK